MKGNFVLQGGGKKKNTLDILKNLPFQNPGD
jgi:hypothetical protein